jgi:hypothetical protein
MELAGHVMPATSDERQPMPTTAPAPTNAELLRLLEAVRAELADLRTGQQGLADAIERLAARAS